MEINQSPPIFLLGNRRSGTTLLRLMLTNHPHLVVPPEGGFVVRLGWKYDRIIFEKDYQVDRFISDLFQSQNIEDWELEQSNLRERFLSRIPCSYPELVEEIYWAYNDSKFTGTKRRWGDKTTFYLEHLSQIQRYFPQTQFIHLVRDPRAVVSSYKGVSHLPDNVLISTLDWLWSINTINQFGARLGDKNYYLLRYENLVENPDRELKKICVFLNEEYDPIMLEYWKENKRRQLEPERHMEWKKLTMEKVTGQRVSAWKSIISPSEVKTIEALSFPYLKLYKYQAVNEQPAGLTRVMKNLLLGGNDLVRSVRRSLRVTKYHLFSRWVKL